jgi:hypothetical protein
VQASLHWTNGSIDKNATVIVHRTLQAAQQAFRPQGKQDLQEGFRIDGVGEEAFLWPPKPAVGGAFNLRFRKWRVEVWTSGQTEEETKRHARILADAITVTAPCQQRSKYQRTLGRSPVVRLPGRVLTPSTVPDRKTRRPLKNADAGKVLTPLLIS